MSFQWPIPQYPPPPLSANGAGKSVIVVGAGMAGLMAARMLAAANFDVTVLEATDRPGGRALTLRDSFEDDQHVEAGALFIPQNHSYVIGLSEEFGLELLPLREYQGTTDQDYFEGVQVRDPGTAEKWPVTLREDEPPTLYGLFSLYLKPGLDAVEAGPDPRLPGWPPEDLHDLDAVSMAEYLSARGASPGAIEILRLGYLDLWGNGIESVSTLMLLRDMAMSQLTPPSDEADAIPVGLRAAHPAQRRLAPILADVQSKGSAEAPSPVELAACQDQLPPYSVAKGLGGEAQYTVKGGTDRLPTAMAAALGNRVRYGVVVEAVERLDRVQVHCRGGEVLEADEIVLAVPIPILQTLQFSPPLSDLKRRAINEVPCTSVTRVYVQFNPRFYFAAGLAGVANTDLPERGPHYTKQGTWICSQTNTQDTNPGILDVYSTGAHARQLDQMSEPERIEYALTLLEAPFPGARKYATGSTRSWSWDQAEFQRGGYVYFEPGQLSEFAVDLKRAEGPIHFAGSQISALPGWMQGALESGLRAAREIAGS